MATVTDTNDPVSEYEPDLDEVSEEQELAEEEEELTYERKFLIFRAVPAWLVSTFIHLVILLVLGLITIPEETRVVNVLSAVNSGEDGPEMEEFMIEAIDPGEAAEVEEMVEQTIDTSQELEMAEPAAIESLEIATVAVDMSDLAAEMAPSAATLQTLSSVQGMPMSSRSDEMKKKLLRQYGGTESSEAAVTEALKWFSRHQMPNGAWTFQHNLVCNNRCGDPGDPQRASALNAATALGVLPFMGAGQTHLYGDFKDNVRRALLFLIQNGRPGTKEGMPVLDLSERGGNMYSHGLASIALCESYAMTGDPALAAPAQASLNFIVYAQGRDGGWRYSPKSDGDTSVVGWQVMALKSGHMGHLVVPPRTIQGSILFLDKVQSDGGARYGYTAPSTKGHEGCIAIGLLCRMYTGWNKTHPSIVAGVKNLSKMGVMKNDIYYNYYAAQVLRHYGGNEWDQFNNELRDWLVAKQATSGGEKGSWHFADSKSHRGPKEGGRLASTAFATMILEVYYRHMPLYADAAAEDDFPL